MTTSSLPSLPSLAVDEVPLDSLRPDPINPRRISEDELDALERSLRQFGFVQPVLARREDRTVIGGHQRLVAARRLGLTSVPVTWLNISVEQARLLGLALNKIAGSWDDALLARLLADLQATPDLDLTLSGFGEDEITDLLRSLEVREKREHVESFDLDEALEEARRAPRTKPGDLWVLGDHRLLCGDATKADDVARLLDGAQPRLLTTDPPYGVSEPPRWFLARRRVQRAWPRREDVHADRWSTQR
jgi:ParB-like chromosome segregation protein Spo0J